MASSPSRFLQVLLRPLPYPPPKPLDFLPSFWVPPYMILATQVVVFIQTQTCVWATFSPRPYTSQFLPSYDLHGLPWSHQLSSNSGLFAGCLDFVICCLRTAQCSWTCPLLPAPHLALTLTHAPPAAWSIHPLRISSLPWVPGTASLRILRPPFLSQYLTVSDSYPFLITTSFGASLDSASVLSTV